MTKLTYSLPVKVAALFLLIFLFAGMLLSGSGILYLYLNGVYDGTTSYFETVTCTNLTSRYAYEVYKNAEFGFSSYDLNGRYISPEAQTWENLYSMERTNFSFTISSAAQPEQIEASNYTAAQFGYEDEYRYGNKIIRCRVSDPITARDGYYTTYHLFTALFPMRYTLIILFAACLLLFVFDLIFVCCAAGHRRNQEGIILNMQDKIPLDLYLLCNGFIITLLCAGGVSILQSQSSPSAFVIFGVLILIASVFLLAAFMTLVTRIKLGKWWRNTVIFRVFHFFLLLFRRIGNALMNIFHIFPMLWKTILIFCAVTLINFVLAYWFFHGYGGFGAFFFGLIFNALLLLALCSVSLSLQKLRDAGERLSSGDFESQVDSSRMFWDFKKHAENLNRVAYGMNIAVEQRMKSERLKTELITNVSHDIKTPLTSIINYVDLLGKEELDGQAAEYVAVLDRQARRLKKLTEDLVEASKASTGNLAVDLVRTGVCELINQAVGEYSERFEAAGLTPVVAAPEKELFILADGRLIWRIVDNLLGNACKYSQPETRLYLTIAAQAQTVSVTFKNISRDSLNISADELMERFVRGDSSRSTEGSGLGLNIAKSLTELQHGTLSLSVDGDLFKAELRFPAVP